MKHKVKISVSEQPKASGIVSCRNVTIRDRLLRFLIGDRQKVITCEVLGISELDDDVFDACVDIITADTDEKSNILMFHMTDGEVIVKRWENTSQSRSWTPEMKDAAKESGRKGGLKRWQEKM